MIFIDIDSTVAQFMTEFLRIINRDHGTDFKSTDIKTYNLSEALGLPQQSIDFVFAEIDLMRLEPIKGAIAGVKYIHSKSVEEIVFLTARNHQHIGVTRRWIDKHFGDIHILHTEWDKIRAALQYSYYNSSAPTCLIDDAPHEIEGWEEFLPNTGILMSQPWNHGCRAGKRCHIWPLIVDHMIVTGLFPTRKLAS